ncbi:hypothetical protein HDU99_009074 [Rhizoclosmatium hyalinum]|nr:hypothetical protein HDU99_009074 [Rhizoclosmatium hyalinum]
MTQELQNLDTEEYIECGSLEWNENPTFLFQPHIVKVKEAVTEFDIVDVTKVKMVPFENPWRNEKQQKKQYSVGLMGGVIRGWHGRVRLFTTRRDVYKLRIAVLKSTIESKKELLISQKAHLKQVGMQLGGNETALDSLNNSLAQYEKALQQCKSEMCDLRFFIGCIDLYKSVVADNRSIVADQVELLVQAYVNHALGDPLPKYEPRAEAVPNVSRAEAVPKIATIIRDVTGHLSGVFLGSSR